MMLNKYYRKIVGAICMLVFLVASLAFSQNSFAGGWVAHGSFGTSSGGGGGGGGGCSGSGANYLLECTGYSWIHYSPTEEAKANKQGIFVTPGQDVYNAVIPAQCIDEGGFWHLGRNARGVKYSGTAIFADTYFVKGLASGTYFYSTSVGSWGHMDTYTPGIIGARYGWASYSGNKSNLGHVLYAGDTPMYYADSIASSYYGENNSILGAYQKAAERAGEAVGADFPSDMYAFCSSEDGETVNPPKYHARSNVSVSRVGGGYSEWTQTNKVGQGEEWEEEGLTVENVFHVGDTAKVTFSHEIFSDKSVNGQYWVVNGKKWEDFISWGSGDYESSFVFVDNYGDLGQGNANLNVSCGGGCFTTNPDKVKRDEITIKFNKAGTWTYCEVLAFQGIQTAVCATINVEDVENNYYAKSNVGIRDAEGNGNDYKTTGIVKSHGSANSSVTVPVNTVSTIVFSHNVYSSDNFDKTEVEVTTPSFGNGASLQSSVKCGIKNGKVDSWTSYSRQDGDPDNVNYEGNPRNCSDGTYNYISRDTYQVKFTVSGKEYDFCEEIKVGGETKAKVCAHVKVGNGSGGGTSSNICNTWASSRYTSSLTSSVNGYTEVVSKVKDPSSGYSDWTNSVFAKPGDRIYWVHCYYPGVQHLYNMTVTPNNSHPEPRSMSPITNNLNNGWFSNKYTWQNQYTISNNNMTDSTAAQKTYSFIVGNTTIQKTEDDKYYVEYGSGKNKAGKTIKEINTSGIPSSVSRDNSGSGPHSWSCNRGESCSKCGTGQKCSGSGENRTCTTYCKTCYLDTCKHDSKFYSNSRDTSPVSSHADVKVPYNFTNTAEITLNGEWNDDVGRTVVYAGETTTVQNFKVKVWTRYNSTLNGTYATQVNDAKIQVVTYVSNGNDTSAAMSRVGSGKNQNICSILSGRGRVYDGMCKDNIHAKDDQDFNEEGYINSAHTSYSRTGTAVDVAGNRTVASVDTDTYFSLGASVNVYDVDVSNNSSGDKFFCVVAAVYPNTVVNNTDMDSSGSNDWYISSPKCQKIAKKPTFQILGGGLYSAGDIEASAPVKNNLYGISNVGGNSYTYNGTGGNTAAFNPWVEQGIVAIGEIDGVTSGAATGLNSSLMYGSFETGGGNYCDRVPLSFANDQCTKQGTTGNIMGGSGGLTGSKNVDNPGAVAEYWLNKMTNPTQKSYSGAIGISDEGNYSVAGSVADIGASTLLRYTYASGNLTLKAATIPNQITHIVKATGNITITDNIGYDKSQEIALLNYIPKLVIYAQGDLNIQCNVTKIDAILIANGKINTCSNISDVNSEGRSVQLTINGAVVARQIEFNRTYGAAAGVNSGVPAEIVNYDVSSILWGRYVAGSSQSNDLTMTYQHELAPRL